MPSPLQLRLKDIEQIDEFIGAVADLLLARSGEFTTTFEMTTRVCDRYFAEASPNRATNVASWPTSKAQQNIKDEEFHETRTSLSMHSSCA